MRNVKPGMIFKYVGGRDLPEEMRFLVVETYICHPMSETQCLGCTKQNAKVVITDSPWQDDLLLVQTRCIGSPTIYEEVISEDTEETVET